MVLLLLLQEDVTCQDFQIISLHTHSVWQTICDTGPSLGEEILCSKCPILGKSVIPTRTGTSHGRLSKFNSEAAQQCPPPPSPRKKMEIWSRLGTLCFRLPTIPTSQEMKIWLGLRTLSFRLPAPSPLWKWKLGQDLGLWVLGCQQYHLTTPPPRMWRQQVCGD